MRGPRTLMVLGLGMLALLAAVATEAGAQAADKAPSRLFFHAPRVA